MSTYIDFCTRYELSPEAPDSRLQYQRYREAYEILTGIAGK